MAQLSITQCTVFVDTFMNERENIELETIMNRESRTTLGIVEKGI